MAAWDIVSEAPGVTTPAPANNAPPGLTVETAPQPDAGMPPEANALYDKLTRSEGTNGKFVYYGGEEFKPGKDFPDWSGAEGPQGKTHAAGPVQWQPDTWNGLKPEFEKQYGRSPDFSSIDDQKRMAWLKAGEVYGPTLAADIKSGKVDWSKLGSQWTSLAKSGGEWGVTQSGKWKVAPEAIAQEQAKTGTDVVWMSPEDYLAMTPPVAAGSQRKSLLKSLDAGELIDDLPSLDVESKDGRAKIVDQDGRNRATVAKENGVDLIPVAVHGAFGAPISWLTDMRGATRRFNFLPVAPANRPPTGVSRGSPTSKPADGVIAAIERGLRAGWGNGPVGLSDQTARELRDIGIFNRPGGTRYPLGAANETAARAVAVPLDILGRGTTAALGGLGGLVGQMATDLGIPGVGTTDQAIRSFVDLPTAFAGAVPGAAGPVDAAGAVIPVGNAARGLGARLDARAAASGQRAALRAGMTPERAALAEEGIDRFNLPLTMRGRGEEPRVANQQAFNREVAKTFGADADKLTPPVMDGARQRIGATMDRIEARNSITLDDQFLDRLADVESVARDGLVDSEYLLVRRQIDNVLGRLHKGDFLPGRSYGNLLHRNAALDRALAASNPNVAAVAGELRSILQDALERSLTGDDLAAYRNARHEYRNLKTVEPLAAASPTGDIDPAALNRRISQRDKRRAYDTSGDALDRLGKIGAEFLRRDQAAAPRGGMVEPVATTVAALAGHSYLAGMFRGITALAHFGRAREPLLAEKLVADALGHRRSPAMAALRATGQLPQIPNNAAALLLPLGASQSFRPQPSPPAPVLP